MTLRISYKQSLWVRGENTSLVGSTTAMLTTTTSTAKAIFQLVTQFLPNFYWKVSGIKQQHPHFHQQQQNKNKSNNKYISAITAPILTRLITITTETSTIITKTKTHSTITKKSQFLMTQIGPSFKARFLDQQQQQN